MNRGGDRTSVRARHAAAERSRAALELRLRRVSYDDIARQLGYSNRAAAWKAIEREIAKVRREPAKELLALELETLDAIQRRMMPLVLDARPNADGVDKGPDLWAVDRVIAIMDRRARMVGLDKIRDDSGVDEFRAVLVQWSRSLTAAVENDEREDECVQ